MDIEGREADYRLTAAMLARLSIRDIVLIEKLDIDFAPGLSVLTGETGAGKSILLDSLSLALGARGDASLEDVEQAVAKEVARIASDGVTADELEKAKKRFVRATIFARDRQSGMANIFGSTLATGGTVQDLQEWPDRIAKVTPEQVKAAAARYLLPSRSTTGYLLPQAKGGN